MRLKGIYKTTLASTPRFKVGFESIEAFDDAGIRVCLSCSENQISQHEMRRKHS